MKKFTRNWKEKDKEYLMELQAFLDVIENIHNAELRESIRYHMLRCDEIITNLAEKMFTVYYQEGVNDKQKCIKK